MSCRTTEFDDYPEFIVTTWHQARTIAARLIGCVPCRDVTAQYAAAPHRHYETDLVLIVDRASLTLTETCDGQIARKSALIRVAGRPQ